MTENTGVTINEDGTIVLGAGASISDRLDIPRLKLAEKGEKARFLIPSASVQFAIMHYVKGLGRVRCPGNIEEFKAGSPAGYEECPMCKVQSPDYKTAIVGIRQLRFAIPILRYVTSNQGPNKGRPRLPLVATLHLLDITHTKWDSMIDQLNQYQAENGETDLSDIDWLVTCEEPTFHNWSFRATAAAHLNKNVLEKYPESKKELLEQFTSEEPNADTLRTYLGRDLPMDVVEAHFTKLMSETPADATEDAPTFLDEEDTNTTEDSDGLLDDFLADLD